MGQSEKAGTPIAQLPHLPDGRHRLVLGVEVRAGNEHTAKHTQPGLLQTLDDLPPDKKPQLVRGDSAFGNDPLMTALEARCQPYLFKLKLSKNVKRHIGSLFRQSGWTDAGQDWEGELALAGWETRRRVVVIRRALTGEVMMAGEDDGQQVLAFIEVDKKAGKGITGYEYAVLVTNTDYDSQQLRAGGWRWKEDLRCEYRPDTSVTRAGIACRIAAGVGIFQRKGNHALEKFRWCR